ncbi:polysaccharide biosynthesis/export family protein [Sphingomonas humi]|uniref:Polysaccharide export protein N-terminal domain-containing protein n=1 Tax=Sphingomonas humi TaxID=335630 RepID=A0ABP7RQZ8_9SPHN
MARFNIILALLFAVVAGGTGQAQAQQASQQAPAGVAYRINPGDEIDVLVWGDERLQRSVRVLPDGTFAFPLVGQVVAAGKLPAELERIITAGLQPQYRGQVPQVTVSVKSPSGFQFSVIGKVRAPGTFTPGRYVNALEALSIAGGASEFADLGNARIIRKSGDNLLTIRVRVVDALKGNGGRLSTADIPQIQSGDTLVIP